MNESSKPTDSVDLTVVIPVYNHIDTLRDVVERTLEVHPDVIVVDDGSTPPAQTVLDGLSVTLVRHDQNQGKGAALRTGADEAHKQGKTHMATIDADAQHDPRDLEKLIVALKKNPWSLVIGHRDFSVPNVPLGSKIGRALGNFWIRLQTGQVPGDIQSGFRIYPVCVIRELKTWMRTFAFEVEIVVRAAWADIELVPIPISVNYPPPEERISHFRVFMDNMKLSFINTHLTMRSVFPWPHPKLSQFTKQREKITILHPLRSLKQLLTENLTPARLASAAALGVLIGTPPLLFVHMLVTFVLARFLNLNKAAAVSAGNICMPPVVPALCIEVGYFMRHGHFFTEVTLETLGYQAHERLLEWVMGSLVVGPLLAGIVWIITYVMALGVAKSVRKGK
jgi:glycosyltransferase involved in cell wall biosynthesis